MYGKKNSISKTAFKIAVEIKMEHRYADIVESGPNDFKKLLEDINPSKYEAQKIKLIRKIARNTTMATRSYRDRLNERAKWLEEQIEDSKIEDEKVTNIERTKRMERMTEQGKLEFAALLVLKNEGVIKCNECDRINNIECLSKHKIIIAPKH